MDKHFSYATCIHSRDLLYNLVPTLNSTVLYTYNIIKKVDLKLSVFTKIKRMLARTF